MVAEGMADISLYFIHKYNVYILFINIHIHDK